MDDLWFNVIFNEDFDDDYDTVMNCIVDHINYPSCEGCGASVADVGDDNDGNDDNNDDDNSNDDDGNDESDDDDDKFILRRQFDMNKLIICMTGAINMYYINYMYKEPYMVSYNIGMCWLNEILRGH
jgi:hypothetical protein